MSKKTSVLFVLENDYFPRDTRVYNECITLSDVYSCYVLAPRQAGEKFIESIQSVRCFRYPHFEARSLRLIFLEYAIAGIWIAVLVPLIAVIKQINVVHVANPPDFVIPIISWLKLFGTKLTFDIHDLSIETFKGKSASKTILGKVLEPCLKALELLSIQFADLIITTNRSISDHARGKNPLKRIHVVRNSNPVLFKSTTEINKSQRTGVINIGYFGVLAADEAAGLDNFFIIATTLAKNKIQFKFSVIGSGPGLSYLQRKITECGMEERFDLHGFVRVPQAFEIIKNFDFGLVTWGYLPKNHLHTAMKVMDYMCCAVPVCSLRLKEQVNSTEDIGIHVNTFEDIAQEIVETYNKVDEYEDLRERTLSHFNNVLSWELQKLNLISAYASLLTT